MHEITANLHMHTSYSDGFGSHAQVAKAAMKAGLDVVIVTDHNVWVKGPENYYQAGNRRVLLLVGEEVHDQTRVPQKNHLLVFGVERELAPLAYDTQLLINQVRLSGGIAFLAHVVDPASKTFKEGDLSWEDWQVNGFSGIELWNAMSEFKGLLKSRLHALFYGYNPHRVAHGPFPPAIAKWDELLRAGKHVAAIGGSDAHAFPARMGPLRRIIFPYEFHFRSINTHLMLPNPLGGNLRDDRQAVLNALDRGCSFIGYDLPAPTRGFRFSAQGFDQTALMGEEISASRGVTFQIRLPHPEECCLIKDGKLVKSWRNRDLITYITSDPGTYRVEVFIHYLGKRRGWIYSNPIYVKK